MSDLQIRGPISGGTGSPVPFTAESDGAQRVQDAHARYTATVARGNAYFLSVAAGAPTAYVGAAGGTPLLAVHNPTGSNKALALLCASSVPRVVASAVGHTGIELWAGLSVTPTGTQTTPKSALTFASGGVGLGFSNAALTSSTALNFGLALAEYFWGTSVGVSFGSGLVDIGGLIVLMPGMQAAIGATVALTSLTWDVSMFWEEIAIP